MSPLTVDPMAPLALVSMIAGLALCYLILAYEESRILV